jgi:CheY-like chemotaxis protein
MSADAVEGRRGSVLLIEDQDGTRQPMAQLLSARGFSVLEAADGQQALDLLRRRGDVRVIVLDLMLPTMDGWEFRERQRRDAALAGIPTIVLSGATFKTRDAYALRVNEHFRKPVNFDVLVEAIARYCPPAH